VRDEIAFGLTADGELKLETTICHEIRQSGQAVVIDSVADDIAYCGHHTPAKYGFQSYISMPIILADGSFFGSLWPACSVSARPELREQFIAVLRHDLRHPLASIAAGTHLLMRRAAVGAVLPGLAGSRPRAWLGLYIAAEIARAHGGIDATSSPQETRFTFRMQA